MIRNRLKEKLAAGGSAVGVAISIPSTETVELMARMNFDWLFVDTEHSPLSPELLGPLLQVARLGDATPVVRVTWNDPVAIKKCLDVGAMGIIVPWVNTREQAEAAVRAARYPPQGLRGFGPRWLVLAGEDMVAYNREANDEILVIVQIETLEAVENLEAIVSTPGVDGFMIGPADLANSMGYPGDFANPAVEDMIAQIVERGRKANALAAYPSAPPALCQKRLEQGFRMVCTGSDLSLLRMGAQSVLESMGRPLYVPRD
ncbi:MAG: hypothetical protein IPM24_01530 [Bryobacterales bacterium]|nr:hypothetical protein [Bryobacterales bacterium]